MTTTLDKITEMQGKGMSEAEISKQLQDEGISPQEINDSLNQAKVKAAVSQSPIQGPQQAPTQQAPSQYPQQTPPPNPSIKTEEIPQTEQMQQSVMPTPPLQEQQQAGIQQQYPPEQIQPEQQPEQYQGYYPETPQAYPQEAYYPQTAAPDTDTISEIAEQVVQEKFSEFEKKTGDLIAFKNETKDKISDLDERLKRIESSIDKLQQAVIGKIGEFSETTQAISKDLNALHDTTSKLMNPLIDNYKELKKIAKGKK